MKKSRCHLVEFNKYFLFDSYSTLLIYTAYLSHQFICNYIYLSLANLRRKILSRNSESEKETHVCIFLITLPKRTFYNRVWFVFSQLVWEHALSCRAGWKTVILQWSIKEKNMYIYPQLILLQHYRGTNESYGFPWMLALCIVPFQLNLLSVYVLWTTYLTSLSLINFNFWRSGLSIHNFICLFKWVLWVCFHLPLSQRRQT